MSAERHILVVGGGIIGLSTAYHAARRGFRVTVLERLGPDRDGCSYGNAGLVCPSHFVPLAAPGMVALGLKWMWNPTSPFYIKPRPDPALLSWAWKFWRAATPEHVTRAAPVLRDLSLASRAAFEEMASLPATDFGMKREGLLMLCRTAHALEEEAALAGRARELNIAAEVLDARQAAALDSGIRMTIAGAVYFPGDCHVIPHRFMAALQHHAGLEGVTFQWNTEFQGWRLQGNRIKAVRTSRGDMEADTFVLCGGSWSPLMVRGLRLKIPIQAGRGYSLTLRQPRQAPKIPAILTEARIAVTPMGNDLRFGGTMEIAGLHGNLQPARVRGIIDAIPHYYPDFPAADFNDVPPWSGLRPVSPDGLPYVGRTRHHPNLIVAAGHAMLGLSLGPITGRLVAQLAAGEPPQIDIGLLSPDRYNSRA